VAYTWRRRGAPLRIPTPGSNARVAVCGAYRWPRGPFVFSHGPRSVDTARFVEMVTQLGQRARRTGRKVMLVLDNGSAHTSRRSTEVLQSLEGLVQVIWLPPYSSEQLNDIEGLWKHMKEDYFSRMLVTKRETFERAAVALLHTFKSIGALRRLLRRPAGGCAKFVRVA
jgi:transposase